MNLNTETFNRAKSIVAEICSELDITPSLIHVGMLQYSDAIDTRIEFGLNQYTKYYQVNQSLENVFHSKGRRSDLSSALTVIDEQVRNALSPQTIHADENISQLASSIGIPDAIDIFIYGLGYNFYSARHNKPKPLTKISMPSDACGGGYSTMIFQKPHTFTKYSTMFQNL